MKYLDVHESLWELPWPLATAYSQLLNSYEHEMSLQYSDQRNRMTVEEKALDLMQSFCIHHFDNLTNHYSKVLEIIRLVLSSDMPSAVIAACFRLLQTINSQLRFNNHLTVY